MLLKRITTRDFLEACTVEEMLHAKSHKPGHIVIVQSTVVDRLFLVDIIERKRVTHTASGDPLWDEITEEKLMEIIG